MKFFAKTVLIMGIFLSSTLGAFAIDAPTNISATEVTDTSLLLNWNKVGNAFGYHVYFSEKPSVEILTAQKKEYITDVPLLINKLKPGTKYYFVVNAFDEQGDESNFSAEKSFMTKGTNNQENESIELNSATDFKLSNIEVLAQNQISLLFTSALENTPDSERIFKIVNKNDELIKYAVGKSEIDGQNGNKVIVTFKELLPVDTEFKLTVISILDGKGRNLESGIESFENFIIENDKLNYVYQEETDTIVIINADKTTTALPGTDKNITTSDDKGVTTASTSIGEVSDGFNSASDISGNKMEDKEIKTDIVGAGKDADKLPTTGPEHIFMLILALVFGALAFVFKFKQS